MSEGLRQAQVWILASWNDVENHFYSSAYALDCNAFHYRYCVWRLTSKIERTHLIPRSSWGRIIVEKDYHAPPAMAGNVRVLRESRG
jgi:hypothetical protein